MILPSTYTGAILCLTLSLLCWGMWANLQKLTGGKWRYELFFWDFSFGVALAAAVAAFTLGSAHPNDLTFQDNLLIASYHKWSYALEGGALFCLANVFLIGALSIAPMAAVFPISMGIGLVVQVGWLLFPPQGNVLLLAGGAVLVLIAVVIGAFTYSTYSTDQKPAKSPAPDPKTPPRAAVKPPLPSKGVTLSVISGLLLGLIPPLADVAKSGDDGLGAYSAGLLFALAALGMTFVYAPFFITFPVHGAPVQLRNYFKGSKSQHLYGLLAGALWSAGLIAAFSSGGTLATIQVGQVLPRAFAEGAAVLATLCGLLGWREFRGASHRVRILLFAMLILWIVGAALVALAPSFGK